jgi:sugar lactone lactonase YvrE
MNGERMSSLHPIPPPEKVVDCECHTGENPLWHPEERCLYWTDIPRGKLFRFFPETGRSEQCFSGAPVGGFTLQADGALLLFMARGAVAVWNGGALRYIVDEIPGERTSRFNDVIADPAGRVFCGTMPAADHSGRLYRLDPDGSLHVLLEGVGIPNGMAFTPDRRRMYFTDSTARRIFLFDYEAATGALSNRRVWLQTPADDGVPDGMTVDSGGGVWSARWNGSALYRYSPDGKEDQRATFPARKVSSVTFGGDEYQDLYVTTALGDGARTGEGPGAGALYRLRPAVRGVPEFCSRIGL